MDTGAAAFTTRGLEIHNARMWRWAAIENAVQFMQANGLNTLILHQNDLIDSLVLPPGPVSADLLYTRWPILRSTLAANRLYMRQLVRRASDAGIGVFFEVKELWFPDQLIEMMPELRSDCGAVCPTHPYWPGFLEAKIQQLVKTLPDLGGIIVSPATRESKATIATRSCDCARCAEASPEKWYETILAAMHRPLAVAGKTLVVRDFAYSASEQSLLVRSARAVSEDIVMALKNVPHDFWPTFPNNPVIGVESGLRQWVEFDVLGQYCGLGAVPCSLVDDLRSRLAFCQEQGVDGVWFRTDWELLHEISTFNSLNMVNLHAGAQFALDPSTSVDDVYAQWAQRGVTTALRPESVQGEPERISAEALRGLARAMKATWPVIEHSMYTRGHVFQYSSKISPTLADMFYVPSHYHTREDWDPGSLRQVEPTAENVAVILAEKDEAGRLVRAIQDSLDVDTWGVSARLKAEIKESFELLGFYCDMYRHVVALGFLASLALHTGNPDDLARAVAVADEFRGFHQTLGDRLAPTLYPPYYYWLFDLDLLAGFEADVRERLATGV